MKAFNLFTGLATTTVLMSCNAKDINSGKPNVVLIVADDLGWFDTGFMGNSFYETPNLDKLAGESMVFMQAYAGAANCAPSRACLLSGKNTPAHKIYTVSPSDRGDERTRKLIPIPNTDNLGEEFQTLGNAMHTLGYKTASIGKWHVSENPKTRGFDVNIGGAHWGHPKSYFAPYVLPELDAPEGEYLTDRLTNEANKFIDENKEGPFFLYLPYYTVHSPIQGKKHLTEKYTRKIAETGCSANPQYAAMVENMDSCIGTIIASLKAANQYNNTILIFTSDNGGIREVSCNSPLRAGKGSYYEGGIRVPLTIRWPGHTKSGKISQYPAVNLDFFPTLMDILGGKTDIDFEGISLKSVLNGAENDEERVLYWHYPIYLEAGSAKMPDIRDKWFRTRPGTTLRKGDWKINYYYEDSTIELFNLKEDPAEKRNLTELNPDKRNELKNLLDSWLKETGADIPSEKNPAYIAEFDKHGSAVKSKKSKKVFED